MRRIGEIWNKFTLGADLPDEPIPGLPLIEIVDNRRVLIENHRGVKEYGETMIRIKVKYGSVCVYGQNLELTKMLKGQLIISGTIESVQLCRG